MTTRELLIAHAIYYKGNWLQIYRVLVTRKYIPDEESARLLANMRCKAITILDPEYPEYLRQMTKPPFVLFYYGDINLISDSNRCLAVVGTRNPSPKGIDITRKIVKDTCKDYITVSGMASGIDRIAHETAINNRGKTVAVLGSGIDVCFPSENSDIYEIIRNNHLVISEYPEGCPPGKMSFPIRNRIVAMISKALLVTESKIHSGTSITVNYALDYGKNVMAVPSTDYGDSGCNLYIKQGAFLVEDAVDVEFVMDYKKLLYGIKY